MRRPPAPLALLLVLAFAGCGQAGDSAGAFDGEEGRVAATVEDLEEAARDGDEARVCRDLLSPELTNATADCRRAVQAAIDDADSTLLTVQDVTISGDSARARVVAGTDEDKREEERTIELVRERGRWRISSLGAS